MRYLSVCSGIEAATVAWHPLGWQPAAFSEIEAFPRAVLSHHYPDVPLHGDFTTIGADEYGPIDLLVGGTPCQSFSIAGLRGGLADDRGNLALEFLRLADRTRARWLVWENVPGVLSSNGGRDFGSILGGLAELGYGFAYRVLDAQHFGVPQRRRRVFVVGYSGDWRRAAAVLFERHSLQGNPAPRRQAGPSVAALTANGVGTCGADDNQGQAGHLIPSTGNTAHCLNAGGMGRQDYEIETLIAHSLRGEGFDAKRAPAGAALAFLLAHVGHGSDECVEWPFARFASGYGSVYADGKNVRAHRLMCQKVYGNAPSNAPDAAHSCGNRACINPRHLRWASRAENMADTVKHGTAPRGERHGASRLTEGDAREVLNRLAAGETHQSIADDLGVGRTTITDIAKGKNWAWLQDGTGRGTPLVPVGQLVNGNQGSGGNRSWLELDEPHQTLTRHVNPNFIAFTAKDHGADALADCSPTLRAGGHSNSHANAGVMPAVAFNWQSGGDARGLDPRDTVSALTKEQTPATLNASAVRRLTPRECERLQGFPETQKCYTILVCRDFSDQQKSNALAALQSRKLQSNAWLADASGWTLSAEAAEHHSGTSRHDHAPRVAVDALIDLERQVVRLHSAGRSLSLASNADERSEFPLPTGIDSFARLAALLTQTWALTTSGGKVGSQANIKPSSPLLSGSGIAISFGRETAEPASDVVNAIETANRLSTSTTLPSGLDIETLHSILTTLSCCVVRAIVGCIPGTTSKANCFAVRLTTSQGYTAIPYRGKPAAECPDGPRYKALGNSMAVPVMRWIGERIQAVESACALREAA